MVTEGVTEKPSPLNAEPIKEPPEAASYQSIRAPTEIALIEVDEPIQTEEGLAVTIEGAEGTPTATAIGVLDVL